MSRKWADAGRDEFMANHPDAVWRLDKDLAVVAANDRAGRLAPDERVPEACLLLAGRALEAGIAMHEPAVAWERNDGEMLFLDMIAFPEGADGVVLQARTHGGPVSTDLRIQAGVCEALMDASTESVLILDRDGIVLACNEIAASRLGRRQAEMVGRDIRDFQEAEVTRRREEWMRHVIETRSPLQVRDEREGRVYEVRLAPIMDDQGEVVQVAAFARDMSGEIEAARGLELALKERDRYRLGLESTFRSIPDAVVTLDENRCVIAMNDAMHSVCRFWSGIGLGDTLPHDPDCAVGRCFDLLKRTLENGESTKGVGEICPGLDGGQRRLEMSSSPLAGTRNNMGGAVAVIKDVTRLVDLERKLEGGRPRNHLVGQSPPMREVYELVEHLADVDSTVLVTGESGTGKELVAEALHQSGLRSSRTLVKVNCSALPESLLESELFGHVRGSFTGAGSNKVGRIEAAEGGTLFLDEIGELSPLIQLKLLRFLEMKEYERVGEVKTRKADVRVVAATNADLREKVRQEAFRRDLFFRINVVRIRLPELRSRLDDVPLLVDHFLRQLAAPEEGAPDVSEEVMKFLMQFPWPGNVRQLRHAIEHALIMSRGKSIQVEHLPRDLLEYGRKKDRVDLRGKKRVAGAGPEEIFEALRLCNWNKAKAARLLGISRVTLYRRLERHPSLRERIEALRRSS